MNRRHRIRRLLALILTVVWCLEGAAAAPAAQGAGEMDWQTRQAYYREYVRIAQEISQKLDTDMTVLPMDQISRADWIPPREFRQIMTQVAQWKFSFAARAGQRLFTTSPTKYAVLTAGGQRYLFQITGIFTTQLNEFMGQQFFAGCQGVRLQGCSPAGSWEQTGYVKRLLDGGRTFEITVSGTLTVGAGVFSNQLARVEFSCNSQGAVS